MDLQAIHKNFLLNFQGHRRKNENETMMLLTVKIPWKMLMMEETILFSPSLFIALVLLNGIMNQR